MAAAADPDVVSLFECPVCMEPFADPRILPACGHHFCLTCLEGIAKLHQQGAVTCPSCRKVTELQQGNAVVDLPRPVMINELQGKILRPISIETNQNRLCDWCNMPKNIAIHMCLQCKIDLCEICLSKHTKVELLMKHEIQDITETALCNIHPGQSIEMFCRTCTLCMCTLCLADGHESHSIESIKSTTQTYTESMVARLNQQEKEVLGEKTCLAQVHHMVKVAEEGYDSVQQKLAYLNDVTEKLKSLMQPLVDQVAIRKEKETHEMMKYIDLLTKSQSRSEEEVQRAQCILKNFKGANLVMEALRSEQDHIIIDHTPFSLDICLPDLDDKYVEASNAFLAAMKDIHVDYKETGDAAMVIEKQNLKLDNTPQTIAWWKDEEERGVGDHGDKASRQDDLAIKVKCLTENVSTDTECFFEREIGTSGGTMKECTSLDDNTTKTVCENNDSTTLTDKRKGAQHLPEVQRTIEEELDRAKQSVSEQITLKQHQLLMLRAIRFDLKEKKVFQDLNIRISNKEIVLTGLPNVISSAKLHMYEIVNSILSENFPGVPESVCRLLKTKPIRDHIVNQFKGNNMCMTWDAGKNDLTVYALNDDDLKMGVGVIMKEVIEAKIKLSESSVKLLHSEKWRQMRESLLSKYPDTLEINVCSEDEQIMVAAISHQCNLVIEDIKTFLSENTILEKTIEVESVKYKFISKAMTREISRIVSDLRSMKVDIQLDNDENCLMIKGNKVGMVSAEKKVNAIIDVLKTRIHDVNKPGMSKYFLGKRGQDFIVAVERRHSVAIELVTETEEWEESRVPAIRAASSKPLFTKIDDKTLMTAKGVKITLIKGGIETQYVDVIVNTTSKNIGRKGGVSGAIFRAAGPTLQAETRQFSPLSPGTIAVTNGHNLKCKILVHVSCSHWDGPNGKCERCIKQIISESLKTAAQSGYTSIAFPAIGTGNNSVPRDKCAEFLYNEVAISQHSSVKDVRFVIYDKDTESVKAFEAEMRRQASLPKSGVGRARALRERHPTLIDDPLDTSASGLTMVQSRYAVSAAASNASGLHVTLGPVELELELGDITKESTDAIINSTDRGINLTMDGVARALAKAGGPQLVAECRRAAMKESIAITSGGNLQATNVIHIAAPANYKEWKKVIRKSLNEADRLGFTSLSFPALGAGQRNVSGSIMASIMLDSIEEFADNKPSNLYLVRIVIYPRQPHILDTFRSEIMKKAEHGKKKLGWSTFNDAMSGAYCMSNPGQVTKSVGGIGTKPSVGVLPPAGKVIKLRVCARSTQEIDAVVREIEEKGNDV